MWTWEPFGKPKAFTTPEAGQVQARSDLEQLPRLEEERARPSEGTAQTEDMIEQLLPILRYRTRFINILCTSCVLLIPRLALYFPWDPRETTKGESRDESLQELHFESVQTLIDSVFRNLSSLKSLEEGPCISTLCYS